VGCPSARYCSRGGEVTINLAFGFVRWTLPKEGDNLRVSNYGDAHLPRTINCKLEGRRDHVLSASGAEHRSKSGAKNAPSTPAVKLRWIHIDLLLTSSNNLLAPGGR
jgi:hypothetical protein